MRRGDIVVVSASGDYGKPRPAVIVQTDLLANTDSILIALITSTIRDTPLHRLTLEPSPANGLRALSQIMADKCGAVIGRIEEKALASLDHALAFVLGLSI